MKRIKTFLIFALLLGMLIPARSQQYNGVGANLKKLGQSTMNFLQVGVIPRATALGDAYTAVGTGSESIFYNPAAICEMDGKADAFVSTTQWIANINYLAGGVTVNLNDWGAVGLSFLTVDYGDIIGTSLLSYDNFSGNPLGYVETGMVDNVGAYAFGLSYARKISTKFLMGGTVKYAVQNLGQVEAENGNKKFGEGKLAYDMGVKYHTGYKGFRFGMTIRNFASDVKYEEITCQLPLTFAMGTAIDIMDIIHADGDPGTDDLLLSLEFIHPNNYTERVLAGLEYTIMNRLAIRTGYIGNHDVLGFNAGVGLVQEIAGRKINLDYSYSSSISYFDDISRISVGFEF
ncbi:PorV/PorQ family protein [bacterium]|nr:PorV/PorQ family protein [bacterium]